MFVPAEVGGYHGLTPEVIERMSADDIRFHAYELNRRRIDEYEARRKAADEARAKAKD